jgi:hypothetical protein
MCAANERRESGQITSAGVGSGARAGSSRDRRPPQQPMHLVGQLSNPPNQSTMKVLHAFPAGVPAQPQPRVVRFRPGRLGNGSFNGQSPRCSLTGVLAQSERLLLTCRSSSIGRYLSTRSTGASAPGPLRNLPRSSGSRAACIAASGSADRGFGSPSTPLLEGVDISGTALGPARSVRRRGREAHGRRERALTAPRGGP